MYVSGCALDLWPDRAAKTLETLGGLDGVDIHAHDCAAGRAALTIEADSVDAEVDVLKAIQALPGVLSARLIFHGTDEDLSVVSDDPARMARITEFLHRTPHEHR